MGWRAELRMEQQDAHSTIIATHKERDSIIAGDGGAGGVDFHHSIAINYHSVCVA